MSLWQGWQCLRQSFSQRIGKKIELSIQPICKLNTHKLNLYKLNTQKSFVSLFLIGAFASLAIAACGGGSGNFATSGDRAIAKPKDVSITLVSFAVTRAAYQGILPKFTEYWQKEHNQNVRFKTSYGGSGSQSRAVIDGLGADVVHLALALDTKRIEKEGFIKPGWEKEFPNNSIVSQSVAALVTREGNPKGINTWSDLTKEEVRFVTADPKTSGVARWNFLTLWNAAIKSGQNEAQATEFVTKAYNNVPILSRDAREATDAFFKQNQGDALINYENEIILAQQKGINVSYVIPDVNISIDNPIAIVDENVERHKNREVVTAFVNYLFTAPAQQEFAKVGFRPVDPTLAQSAEIKQKYPPVPNLGTVKDFGGWDKVQKKFFADGAMFDQIQAQKRS